MKLLQVAEQNKSYYSADYTKGFNDGAKAQYEADRKDAERHGRWILPNKEKTDRPMAECSICGWYVTEGERLDFTYCPNCGAKMDEVDNENPEP